MKLKQRCRLGAGLHRSSGLAGRGSTVAAAVGAGVGGGSLVAGRIERSPRWGSSWAGCSLSIADDGSLESKWNIGYKGTTSLRS